MRNNSLLGQMKADRWVRPYFAKYRKQLRGAIGLGVATFAFAALMMFTAGYLISRTAEIETHLFLIFVPIAFVQIFGLGKPVLHYIERLLSHDWVFRMTSSLRLRLYNVLERDAMRLAGTRQTGDVLGLVAEDIGHLQNLYLRTIFPTVIAWLLCGVVVIALGVIEVPFALLMLLALAVYMVLLPYVSVRVNRARIQQLKDERNRLYTELTDDVLGATDWVFSGRESEYRERYRAASDQSRVVQKALNRYSRINDLVAMVLFGVIAIAVLVWAHGHFGGQVGGPANWIAAFVLGVFPLIEAFMPLPMAATQAYTYRDSITRMNALPDDDKNWMQIEEGLREEGAYRNLFDSFIDLADVPMVDAQMEGLRDSGLNDGNGEFDDAAEPTEASSAPEGAPAPKDFSINIENVTFSYEGSSKNVLQDLNLHIEQGSKVAVLGRSGSGKSTLASLIRGDLVAQGGRVALGGVSTCDIVEHMPRYVGVVQQQAYLFNRTLRDNLTLGVSKATDERIWEVLESVELADMVRKLPDGLSTMVDESGTRFSGGERHRIALARVLLADVSVVLLDEPTVGLDPLTESALLDTLFRVLDGKTLVMITHHLQGAEAFDRVVFIEDGRLELDGSPAELQATSERYRKLRAFDRGIA